MRVGAERTSVIVADPPWPHANGSRTNSGKSPKYPVMLLREIAALRSPVTAMAGDDAVLYMWSTTPHLPGAIQVMEAWGFRYRSLLVWRKRSVAAGFWVRSDAEVCLIGERGRPCAPSAADLPRTIIDADRTERRHSSKPDAIHRIVERLWPEARKIELFARQERTGWACYGADLGSMIHPAGVLVGTAQHV